MEIQLIIFFSLLLWAYAEKQSFNEIHIVGNEQPLTIKMLNSKVIKRAALNGTHLYNQIINPTSYYYKLICLKSGTRQIVSGLIYSLNVTLQKTKCLKKYFIDEKKTGLLSTQTLEEIEKCASNQKNINTTLNILYKPWNPVSYTLL